MIDALVAIMGGGPAGSATALHLLARRPDLRGRVHLFERRRHPREKPCGGAVSAWGVAALHRLGLWDRVAARAITGFGLRLGERFHHLARPGLGVVVRRSVFDAMLFAAAEERGAIGHQDCAVEGLARAGERWELATGAGPVRATVLVGADGASGQARRLLGLGEARRRAHLYLVETPGLDPRDHVADGSLLFDMSPVLRGVQGYYWDFPAPLDGVEGTSRGLFHLNADDTLPGAALRATFDDAIRARGVVPGSARRKSWAIRPYAPGARASVRGALLVGEAVGVDPVTGEGIAHALAYGRLAAREIDHALTTGDRAFERWPQAIAESFLGRHLRQACRVAPWLYGPERVLMARAMTASPQVLRIGVSWYAGDPPRLRDAALLGAVLAREAVRARGLRPRARS